MRRLFTASAGVSLLACMVSGVVATWPTGRRGGWAVARYGRLVIVQREGQGVVMVTTMRWPRNEPWVAVKRLFQNLLARRWAGNGPDARQSGEATQVVRVVEPR